MVFLLESLLLTLGGGYIARLSVCRLRSISDQERLPALCFQATFVSSLLYARSFMSFPLTDVSAPIVS